MLEKTEEEIKNGQSIDTGNIGHSRHMTKTSKTKNTTQHRKIKIWATQTPPNTGSEPRWPHQIPGVNLGAEQHGPHQILGVNLGDPTKYWEWT